MWFGNDLLFLEYLRNRFLYFNHFFDNPLNFDNLLYRYFDNLLDQLFYFNQLFYRFFNDLFNRDALFYLYDSINGYFYYLFDYFFNLNGFFYRYFNQFLNLDPYFCLLYTSPSPRDKRQSRMPSSA